MTILPELPQTSRRMVEGTFSPLSLVCRFTSLDDAIRLTNCLAFEPHGVTNDGDNVLMMVSGIGCGNLSTIPFVASVAEIPIGGVKNSGMSTKTA